MPNVTRSTSRFLIRRCARPPRAPASLGVAHVVAIIEDAKARNKPWVYLGYRVAACASLAYKGKYKPHELLVGRPEPDEEPRWTKDE